ncbi:NAD-dependent deacylase [Anaerolineales bacterium]
MPSSIYDKCARLIKDARHVVITTGAGVSQESGIPTFRDALDGLWERYDPTELATPAAFEKNPKLVWDCYQYRRQLIHQSQPNAGHFAISALQAQHPDLVIITQNIDSLHELAGSKGLIHLHGSIDEYRCSANCQGRQVLIDLDSLPDKTASPPKCPNCGQYVRPNIVWFGESLQENKIHTAYDASAACNLMIVIGTSGQVQPAASLPMLAKQAGAKLIEINPQPTPINALADIIISERSGHAMPAIVEAFQNA